MIAIVGYKKGHKTSYWKEMKDSVLTISHNQKVWRKKMAAKGYRTWTGGTIRRFLRVLHDTQKGI